MMEVQKYLKEYGLEKLKEEFSIVVREYPDRIVLNYNQIESPRFHPVVDECRALILQKDTWKVLARSFDRFFNWQESVDGNASKMGSSVQRVADYCAAKYVNFPLNEAKIQSKLDGSLLTCYFDGDKWCVSTRSMAYAEGQTTLGPTFADLFWKTANQYRLVELIDLANMRDFNFVFELTGPLNRIVTPYEITDITLIGSRYLGETLNPDDPKRSFQFREMNCNELDAMANAWKLNRPKTFNVDSVENLLELVNGMPSMEEGVVLVVEGDNASHWRVKVKNAKYLAISNMRQNGTVSPHRILTLIMENEQHEYLRYFPEDQPYFTFVEAEYIDTVQRIKDVYKEVIGIEDQKTFALTMMPKTVYSFEKGILFSIRKNGETIEHEMKELGAKKISVGMNLRGKFAKKFGIEIEED